MRYRTQDLTVTDVFCGAGGTSQGEVLARAGEDRRQLRQRARQAGWQQAGTPAARLDYCPRCPCGREAGR